MARTVERFLSDTFNEGAQMAVLCTRPRRGDLLMYR